MQQPRIKAELLQALEKGSTITSFSVDEMLNEAVQQYVECNLATLVESRAERCAGA